MRLLFTLHIFSQFVESVGVGGKTVYEMEKSGKAKIN